MRPPLPAEQSRPPRPGFIPPARPRATAFPLCRAPCHHELAAPARRRGFDTAETTDLLETAERAMDQLLLATMTGHSKAAAKGSRARSLAGSIDGTRKA